MPVTFDFRYRLSYRVHPGGPFRNGGWCGSRWSVGRPTPQAHGRVGCISSGLRYGWTVAVSSGRARSSPYSPTSAGRPPEQP